MTLSRREFIQSAALLSTTLAAGYAAPARAPMVGTQLYGWGQYYQRQGRDLFQNLDEVFSAVRDAGYDYAEGSLDMNNPEANGTFAEKFKARGLKPACIYTGGLLHEEDQWETTVQKLTAAAKVCAEAGYTVINCNPDTTQEEKTARQLETQAAALDILGRDLRQLGLELAVHNHDREMRSKAREFHHNFRATKPELVRFCFDVHWVYRGGLDPMEALREHGARVASWHLRQSRDKIWWEDLAPGDIDYKAIASHAREHQLGTLYSVELALEEGTKITRSVVENHRRSREYVRQIFGV